MLLSFPRGWPGVGLLLLRVVVGVSLVVHGWHAIDDAESSMTVRIVGALTICAGTAQTLGCYTFITALLASIGMIGITLGWIPWYRSDPVDPGVAAVFFVSMCMAVALLGPGAISIDAWRRGRREIVIPSHSADVDR